jgi:hypothetical protein
VRRMLRILLNGLTGRDELWRLTLLVKNQPAPVRQQIRAELWRRNRRSSAYWLGGLALWTSQPGPLTPLPVSWFQTDSTTRVLCARRSQSHSIQSP